MFDAQILINPVTGSEFSVFGPWMQRAGDNALFSIDLVASLLSAGTFKIELYTKSSEDAGDGADAAATKTIGDTDAPGRYTWEAIGGLKELVRYRFTFSTAVGTGEWVMFRMLNPSWFDAVDA